jgi:uncharacterized OsmC-like protein
VRLEIVVQGEASADQVISLWEKVDARCSILALLRTSDCKIESTWQNN